MTISQLEEWLAVGYVEANDTDDIEATTKDLIAGYKAMYAAIDELLNTDNDLAYGNCAIVLNRLRLKP